MVDHTHRPRVGRRPPAPHRLPAATLLLGAAVLLPGTRAFLSGAGAPAQESAHTTVLITRHAEKADGEDPALSPTGVARARALARLLSEAGVDAIYVTQYRRTHQTAAPLAQTLGLAVREVEARAVAQLARRVRDEHRGQVVLVVGHSNTVPAMVEALGAPPVGTIGEDEYGTLFVVTIDGAGRASVMRLDYGEPQQRSPREGRRGSTESGPRGRGPAQRDAGVPACR